MQAAERPEGVGVWASYLPPALCNLLGVGGGAQPVTHLTQFSLPSLLIFSFYLQDDGIIISSTEGFESRLFRLMSQK